MFHANQNILPLFPTFEGQLFHATAKAFSQMGKFSIPKVAELMMSFYRVTQCSYFNYNPVVATKQAAETHVSDDHV